MAARASMGVVTATRGAHKAADRIFFPSVRFIWKLLATSSAHCHSPFHFTKGARHPDRSSADHRPQSTSKSGSVAQSLLLAEATAIVSDLAFARVAAVGF